MWRWSRAIKPWVTFWPVFSTYVEVIPGFPVSLLIPTCILRVCGDDWSFNSFCHSYSVYSPRMWRWSYHASSAIHTITVFSTYVEVIPRYTRGCPSHIRILHVCGGDPQRRRSENKSVYFRTPEFSILHTCGGDPHYVLDRVNLLMYSPHMLRVLLSLSAQINSL